MVESKSKSETVTLPRFLYDSLLEDAELVRHLAHYRGFGWINAIKEEMKSDKKYNQGAYRKIIK